MTFEVGPGITGLLGPNGAGKTTLLHMMAGFLRPSGGTVRLDEGRPGGIQSSIGASASCPSARRCTDSSPAAVRDRHGSAARARRPVASADRAIGLVDLHDAAGRAIGGYSKGMRQRVKVAAALVHDPAVLILDEPFNGIDPRQRLHMMALLREMAAEGRTILFSSHILEEVERLGDRVLVVVAAAWRRPATSGRSAGS